MNELSDRHSESPIGRQSDLSIGNLEIPLTDQGWHSDKVSVHRSSPGNVEQYAHLDIDIWTLATNHALDYGVPGLIQTMSVLDARRIAYVGVGHSLESATEAKFVKAKSGEVVAVLNFCSTLPAGSVATSTRPGVSPIRIRQSFEFDGARMDEQPGSPPRINTSVQEVDAVRAQELVSLASQSADHVIVSMHWGVAWPFLPPNQGPLADYQRPLAHRLIDAGASVILGTHSHSLHPIEFYGKGVVLYSMGNYLFHKGESVSDADKRLTPPLKPILRGDLWNESAVFDIDLVDGEIEVLAKPIMLDGTGEPFFAADEDATRILDRLFKASAELDPTIQYENGVFRK